MTFFRLMCVAALLLVSGWAHAGSRGFYVAVYDVSEPEFADGIRVTKQLRHTPTGDVDCFLCDDMDSDDGISILYLHKKPEIAANLLKQAKIGNRKAINQVQKILTAYRYKDDLSSGLDGVYIYERNQGGVTLTAFSSRKTTCKIKTAHRPVRTSIRLDKFDDMLRSTADAFWCGFVP